MCVEVIVCYISVVFLRHSVYKFLNTPTNPTARGFVRQLAQTTRTRAKMCLFVSLILLIIFRG